MMRKLILILGIFLISLSGFSQATSVQVYRIANATTAFGVNVSVGKQIYDIANDNLYVCKTGSVSTLTLTTGAANFTLISSTGSQDLSYNSGTHAIDITGGTNAVIPLAVDDGATEGLSSFTAADFTVTAGNVAIDYANGQKATNAQPGFATAAHITAIEANTAKETNVSTDLSLGTRTATTMDVNSSDGTNATLLAASTTEAGLMTDAQFNKLAAIEAAAQVNWTFITEKFEESSGTPTAHVLGQTAQTAGAVVSLNGSVLAPANYTLTSTNLTIAGLAVAQYDIITIGYNY